MNTRFTPPERRTSKDGSNSPPKNRSETLNTNLVPQSRDFSLLTALVGAMVINESETQLHQNQSLGFSEFIHRLLFETISKEPTLDVIISTKEIETLIQINTYLTRVSSARAITLIDVENLLNTYSHVLNPHSQAGSLQYQILSKSIML